MFSWILSFAASDSAAFDKLRPRASRGELVAGRQSQQKRPHGCPTALSVTTNANKIVLFQTGTGKALQSGGFENSFAPVSREGEL